MFIKSLKDCEEFTAGDGCRLRELLHPDKADLKLHYSLAHAKVSPGQTTDQHKLKGASEVYYIIKGEGKMRIGGETRDVKEGDAVYIPPDAVQSITNTGRENLEFICLVDPAWNKDQEEVF